MSEEPFAKMINGQFIDTREDKAGFLESNDVDALKFYRCILCHRVVNLWDLREHKGCSFCGNKRIQPTNLTLWEKIVQICNHPKVWEWKGQKNKI
jgi:hypothetical protein